VVFRSLAELDEIVRQRRLHVTELDIGSRPYGTCCRSDSDPVSFYSNY